MQLFANNAMSQLAAPVTAADTTLTVLAGDGGWFPALAGGDYFLATLYQRSGNAEINHEVVKVTARAGDVFTIERAYEGAARDFNINDPVELRLTKRTFQETVFKVTQVVPATNIGPIYLEGTGPMEWDPISASYVPKSGGATGGGPDKIFYKNDQVITTDHTIEADENAVSTGPITVLADLVVEGNWVVL